jgi:hypothetical protein
MNDSLKNSGIPCLKSLHSLEKRDAYLARKLISCSPVPEKSYPFPKTGIVKVLASATVSDRQ